MLSRYNQTSRPLSAQSPRRVYNNDYYDFERPRSCRRNDVRGTYSSNVYKNCVDLQFEKTDLFHENHRLKNSINKLKEKISAEERRRVSVTSSHPYDPAACIHGSSFRSLDETTEIERKLIRKENEVLDLKESLEEIKSKLNWMKEDLKKKEYDAMNMMQRMFAVEIDYNRCSNELNKSRKQCDIFWARCEERTNENICLKRELEEKRRSLFSRNEYFPTELYSELQSTREENQKLKDKIKEQETGIIAMWKQDSQYPFAAERDDIEMKKRIDDLKEENRRLLQDHWNMAEKHRDTLHQKDSELSATRRALGISETELKSIRSSFDVTEQKLKRSSALVLLLDKENQQLKDKMSNLKGEEVLQGPNSKMETEEIKLFKEKVSNKEKEIRRLQEMIKTEERKSAQLKNDLSEYSKQKDSLLQRKDSELQELMHKNQRLQNEVTRFISEKSKQPKEESALNTIKLNEIERELGTKRKEIDSLHVRIRQLENENMLLQKEKDSVSKDRHNLHARNSNAADEVKLLQTEVEGKQIEIQRLHDKCTLDEKENKDLQKKYTKVSEERDNLFQKNQSLQGELNELNVKIRHLEENRMKTTDEWKHIEKVQNTVVQLGNDNDLLKQDIASLSKEKDSTLSRYYEAEKEVRHLKLDSKSKGEEIQRLQKQIAQMEGDNEKLQEKLSNKSKEKQQLLESNKRLEKVNDQMHLATDESKRWQEKIKELQNENRHLRHDIDGLSKQKEDAIKRIRDFESVNANYNDQLLLAADESKRLQGRIKDLQGENSRLRRDIDDLSKQKEDALTRLSKVAGAKLTHGNAAITDLSDTDRPTKLAEKFSELYDNAWTDAFEELDNTFHNEEETIKVLLRIFQEAYKFCVETENNYETRIGQAVFTIASKTESHQIKNANVEIQKVLADLRISLSTACCSVIEEMVLSKLPSILKSVDVAACPLTQLFARQCASLSWKMRIRDPPLFVRFEFRCGSTFNSDVLKRYTKTGGYLNFLVWPALYLQENGPVLAKGVAQPKIAP